MSRRDHFDSGHNNPSHFRIEYHPNPDEYSLENHRLTLHQGDDERIIGEMSWSNEENRNMLQSIDVDPAYQRRGLGTQMWEHALKLSQTNPNIGRPRPSNFRTRAGDQWAWAIHARGLSDEPPENTMEPEDEDEYGR